MTGLDADYLHQETKTSPTEKVTKEAGKAARKTANEPTLELKVDRFTGDGQIVRHLKGYAPGRTADMLRDAIERALPPAQAAR